MKKIIICLTILLAATIANAEVNFDSFEKEFDTKFGKVTFDHQIHRAEDCISCHDAVKENSGIDKKFAHSFCTDCHKSKAVPVSCTKCHIK